MSKNIALDTSFDKVIHRTDLHGLFPVFLKLDELSLLIIGGDETALEKLGTLLQYSPKADIILISCTISDEIKQFAVHYNTVRLVERPYRIEDIEAVDIVLVTTHDKLLTGQVTNDALAVGKLLYVEGHPELSDFSLGATVRRGKANIDVLDYNHAAGFVNEGLNDLPGDIPGYNHPNGANDRVNGNGLSKTVGLKDTTQPWRVQTSWKTIASYCVVAFALMLVGHVIFSYIHLSEFPERAIDFYQTLDKNFHWMVLAGFLAQLVDGALGMGYGVTSAAILLSTGINPAAISGSIHTAEMFASGASGYSHYKFGNVNKKLFRVLVVPGVLGAIGGALLLVFLGEKYSNYVRPVLALYTLFLGIKILLNAFRKMVRKEKFRHFGSLAGLGGFLDSFGGGGWGPIVTTTLITRGRTPKFVIGTVSLTEFFVTLASAFTFFTLLGISHWQTIVALILGGFIAAPIAAKLAGKLPRKTSFILLGLLVIFWSLNILSKLI